MIALLDRNMLSVVIKKLTISAFIDGVCTGYVCAYRLESGQNKRVHAGTKSAVTSLDTCCYVC
jgi:hypothetical protein